MGLVICDISRPSNNSSTECILCLEDGLSVGAHQLAVVEPAVRASVPSVAHQVEIDGDEHYRQEDAEETQLAQLEVEHNYL